ncbi:MAG: hypothetical protein ACRCZW_11150 [Lactobacillaceae bacterium]
MRKNVVKDDSFTIDFTYVTKIVGNNKNTRKDKTQILPISEIDEVKKENDLKVEEKLNDLFF